MGNPFIDEIHPDYIIRTFDHNKEPDDFYWHKDKNDRIILETNGNNWKIQLENQLPQNLEPNKTYFIPKETWHRVIKGTDTLILKIQEIAQK